MLRTIQFLLVAFFADLCFRSGSYGQDLYGGQSGILCDGIECPKGTKICLVKKDSIPDTDQMTVERTCKTGDGMSFLHLERSFTFIDLTHDRIKFVF